MQVLVTGATGFLGEHLVDALLARGHGVLAVARASSATEAIEARGVRVARASFDDGPALVTAMRGIDVVIHAAGGGIARRIEDMYRANTASTEALVDAAVAAGVRRFVLVSSLAAHGGSRPGAPAKEGDPDAPRSHYGRSKLAAERALARRGDQIEHTILRPPALYGPGEHRMVDLFRAARRGIVPTVHPRGTLSMLDGRDCASALVAAVEAAAALGTLYVAEPRPRSRREMAELVARAVGREARVVAIPPSVLWTLGAGIELAGRLLDRPVMLSRDKVSDLVQPHQSCDPARAIATLGWRPQHDFGEGAREAYEDYQRRGWL